MIAKGKSIRHLGASINYAIAKEEAVVLDKNIVAETPKEVAQEFQAFQERNHRCERNSLSFVISPTVKDGKEMNEDHLRSINASFLSKMGLEQHQYIAFVHKNTPHKHIHLYVNRIDYQGKAYNDQFVSNRCAHVAEGIAKDRGLETAKEAKKSRLMEKRMRSPEMADIKQLADRTLKQKEVSSVDKFVDVFNQSGIEQGLRAEAYRSKSGAFSGLRFYVGDKKFKASEVDRSLAKQTIEKRLTMNKEISVDLAKENRKSKGVSIGF
ncbi:MAG: relaxase/mobilization nuclease domain-containing protein [Desulfobacteraceae bacterium]|nr:relaxase/mobilization nuclease domain-containing protein [Desulfobacteraceae bacterium]